MLLSRQIDGIPERIAGARGGVFIFRVGQVRYERDDVDKLFGQWDRMPECRNAEGKLYALCLRQPADIVGLCLYLRERGAGALLLHENTPYERARESARLAGAAYLVYGTAERFEAVSFMTESQPASLCQFSSGTTGAPKLVRRTWEDIDEEIAGYNERLAAEGAAELPTQVLVPVFHSFGLITGTLAAIARGVEPNLLHGRNPKRILGEIRDTAGSLAYAVPFLLHLLLALGKDEVRLNEVVSSGAPLTEPLLRRLERQACRIWQQYGCTEAGCIALGAAPSSPQEMGRPLRRFRVSCEPLPGSRSEEPLTEIVAASARTVVRTGDIGFLNAEGSLFVSGRADDLINVSGLKVMPSEVESVIAAMAGVSEVVVCKNRHPVWGEAVQAWISPADGSLREQDVRAWCSERLPAYKVPGAIRLTNEIPRLPSGKISRRLLQTLEEESR